MPGQAWQEGVFDEADHSHVADRRIQDKVYATIGHNACLEARPAVVHFGGFTLGNVHEQRIRLCNTSPSSTRMHIVLPTTTYFKASCENKKGLLAPGMEDVITVEFCPTEWRYYYDCVRIHSQGENMLIPIHAYPMMNQTKFPRRISFGKCAVGETYTKHVSLTCNVPIDFEYEITMLEPNAAFGVQPQQGVVPANGTVDVEVNFRPTRLVTEMVELEVRVAEFQAEAVRCTVSGSGFPGLARQHQLAGLTAGLDTTMSEATPPWGKAEKGRLPKGIAKGGAGGGDPFTRLQTQRQQEGGPRDSRITGPIKAKMPALRPLTPPSTIEGLVVPAHPHQQAHMAMLLNQQPGKLLLTDIQDAIQEKKKVLAEKAATLRQTLGRSKGEALDPLDDSFLSRSAKADLFEYLCLEGQEHRRDVELNALQAMVGSDPLNPSQLTIMQDARQQHHNQAAAAQRQTDMLRTKVEKQAAAANAIHNVGSQDTGATAGTSPQGDVGAEKMPALLRWDCNDGDTWHKRQRALYCFAQAGRKVILRNRATHRLARINALLQKLKSPDARAATASCQTDGPRELFTAGAGQQMALQPLPRAGTQAPFHLDISKVAPSWPLHTNEPVKQYKPVDIPDYSVDFATYQPMEPQVPQYSDLMGYTEEPLPPYTPYAPQMLDMPFMEGPFEEEAGPHPTGLVPELSDWLTMPETCLIRKQPNLPISDTYSTDKVQAQLERDWGLEPGSAIQPCIYAHSSTAELELRESSSVRAMAGQPVLSDLFVPFRQPVQKAQTGSGTVKKQKLDLVSMFRNSLLASDEPVQQTQVPTEAEIRSFMPPDLDYVQPDICDDELQGQSALPSITDGGVQPVDNINLKQQIQTEAQRHSRQLDTKLVAKRQENLTRMQDKYEAYNSQVACPSINKLP